MVLYLLRRDDSVKVALVCALFAPFVLLSGRFGPLTFLQQVAFVGMIVGVRLGLFQRSTRFQMALPIPGRDLLLLRIAGALLAIWFPVVIAALFLVVKHREGLPTLLLGGAVLTLGAILPLTLRLHEAAISPLVSIGLSASVLAAGFGLWFVLPPVAHFALFAALSVALAVRAYLLVPAAFEVSPRSASGGRKVRSLWRFPTPVWWALARTVMPWVGAVIFLWSYLTMNSVTAFPFTALLFSGGILLRTRTGWLHGLPLSRRAILWLMLGVTVVPFLAGLAAATWIYRPSFVPVSLPRVGQYMKALDPRDWHLCETNVPLEYWRHAPTGKIPLIEAPWGETGVPHSMTILGLVLFNPYTATKVNSDRFFEWQFENATQALHGRRISYGQYLRMSRDDRLDYPQHKRVDVIAFAGIAFWALFAAFLQEITVSRSHWGALPGQSLRGVILIFIGAGLMFVFGVSLILLPGTMIFSSLLQALFMRIAALPLATWVLAAIGAVPSLLMYLLLERQCKRSEIVTNPAIPTAR